MPLREELIRLVVHGTLHALGRTHPEGEGRTRSPMWRRQERYVGGARVIAFLQLFLAPLVAAALTLWAAWLALAAESDADLPRALERRSDRPSRRAAPSPVTFTSPTWRCWCSPAPRRAPPSPGGPARRPAGSSGWWRPSAWSGSWATCCPGSSARWRRS